MKAQGKGLTGGPTAREGADATGRGEERRQRAVSPSSRAGGARGVVIVGAGRLGTALALALASRGYEVRALVSRTSAGARRASRRAGLETLTLGANQLERLPAAEIIFVTTPDDLIGATAARLASLPRLDARVALHASGALSSEALAPLRERGLAVGSMHPLAAVSEAEGGAASLARASYCVEGDARAGRAARRVVRDLGGRSFTIEPSRKALYHAAAVLTAGHVVALFDVALETLQRCGLTERRAQRALLPLLLSAAENLSGRATARALTGSFARADVETVRRHLRALEALADGDALAVYKLLGRRSLKLAASAGADPDLVEMIRRLLSKSSPRGGA